MAIKGKQNNQDALVWETINWSPSLYQIGQFFQLQDLLIEWNTQVNLTRLLKGSDYWVSQVLDSLWPLREELQESQKFRKIIDIGTGCGFPGLAIAIALPNSQVTLIDSVGRKTNAVKSISKALGLESRVCIRTERAEVTGQNPAFRGVHDLAVARAVSSAPIVAEYLVPLLNSTGEALLYKANWSTIEKEDLYKALVPLKATVKRIDNCQLPEEKGIRNVARLKRLGECATKYPRPIGTPSKRPLNR